MDEDLSVKAPLTRLRRRLSVESEDSSLPTTPSTPNKKRATRLAAKPQLELIDEVATDNVPKRTTRKAAVKENAEAGLNSGTPTALTPSRRSTRIRSNTSILSETTAQNVESPRAKRATRRNSQLGSDNESAVVTPAKQTRRPRKTSTAKVDKPPGDENFVEVTTTNTEDLEKDSKDSKASETDNHSPSTRKSARFNKKGSEVDDETYKANKESNKTLNDSVNTNKALKDSTPVKESNKILNDSVNANKSLKETTSVNEPNKTLNDSVKTNKSLIDATPVEESNKILNDSVHTNESLKESTPVEESNKSLNHSVITNKSLKESTPVKNEKQINANNETSPQVNNNEEKLSTSSTNLIYEIKTINKNDLNKSTSSIEKIANNSKNKRNRTKSWTTISSPSNIEFISDNEEAKKKRKKKTPNTSIISGAGDASITNDATEMTSQRDIKSLNRSVNLNKSSLRNLVTPCVVSVARVEFDKSDTVKLFENSPGYHQPLVLIEDSDSCSADKLIIDIQESEDQCVPVVVNPTNESLNKHEQSVEPMDIDESMPVNVTINDFSDKSNTSKEEVEMPDKRKSSISEKTSSKDDSINKSKKKTSISNQSASESPKSSMVEEVKSETVNKSKNSSKRNSLTSVYNLNGSTTNKSNKTSSISEVADEVDSGESKKSSDNSLRKSLITIGEDNAKLNESANKCKEKSPVSVNNSIIQNDLKKSIDNTQKNLSISIDEDIEKQNTRKSKRNTSISLNESASNQKSVVDENNDSKSSNKSKRRSVSQTDSQSLENKSTLVISQLQDVSTNDTSPNVTNNELSKSLSGPDKKNKGMDKKNISLNNYLTSTPIQQQPFQTLTMQMNTSIISPSIEDKNKANEKTPKKSVATESLDSATDEEIKFKNKKEMVTLPKKKFSRAPSSSESSDNESDMKSKAPIKIPDKKSPIKKLESSDSDEESDSNSLQSNKKSPNKKLFNRPELKTKNVKTPNKFPTSDSSYTDDSDEVASKNRSNMFDDEASEASDDYQSGDSQDKEDRRYEEEHEIIEKGETLDSEEELSNDSDYEKDSFLVSSDAEDNDMLSGSGDDLSMSDNELTMSAKSKTKFNERKLKQQKKASREMYEARHDKNADNSKVEITKSKKTKRQRLESSNLETENENVEPKKSNRLRIDSSQDGSMTQSDADESIRIKKKKSKRLSESIHDITTNEIEVTMCNQSTTEKNDPLSVAIKQEPKTPQKNFDISTVAINDKIEEVEMDANASILRRNETLDPLQATVMGDLEDSSSSSDNMEFVQMYDSIHLKSQTNKIKTADTSLNLNKKSKKSKDPVIDQLNLTQTKKSNMNKNKPRQKSQAKESSKANNVEENSSDSIDMKLLFPDDSNDSDMNANQFNPTIQAEAAENFIPLKRTDAQTNIPGNMDMSVSELNVSKKNKERKSSQLSPEEILNIPDNSEEPEDSNIKIIIDTKGTHEEVEPPAVLTNSNKKKKKNKSLNESKALEITGDIDWTDGNVETVEASLTSEKNKKKNKHDTSQIVEPLVKAITSAKKSKNTSLCVEDGQPEMQNTEPKEMTAVSSMTSEKKKKKNKQSLQTSQTIVDKTGEESDNEAPIETSYKSEKKSDGADTVTDEAPTSSEKKKHKKNKKKKKNKNLSQSMDKSDDNSLRTNEQEIDGSSKRKRKFYESTQTEDITNAIPLYTLTTSNEKKKRKVLQENESIDGDNVTFSADGNITKKSKKNKKVQNKDDIEQDPLHNTKKRKYSDDDNEQKVSKVSKQNSFDKIHVPTLPDSIINKLSENPQNKFSKKKKTKLAVIATMPFVVEEAERRVNKPSNYLEQSIYLNDTPVKTKQKRIKDKPKVLPFIPTALTSDSGYTSQFNVNVLPEDTQFVAQAINVENFRESFLATQRIKKLGTLERCKAHRSRKISKF